MKKYLREKRMWVSEEEYEAYHAKKNKKQCKEHDYVLVIPRWGVKWDEKYPYNPEAYYRAMQERRVFIEEQNNKLAEIGLIVQPSYWSREERLYICSVCRKHKYESLTATTNI